MAGKILVGIVPYIVSDTQFGLATASLTSIYSFSRLDYVVIYPPETISTGFNLHVSKHLSILHKHGQTNRYEEFHSEVNGLAYNWNKIIRYGLENQYARIYLPNLDIANIREIDVFPMNNKQLITSFAEIRTPPIKSGYEVNYKTQKTEFSNFMLYAKPLKQFIKWEQKNTDEPFPGLFDENIKPVYGEDVDYQYRLERAGFTNYVYQSPSYRHYGRTSVRHHNDPEWARKNLSSSTSHLYLMKKYKDKPRKERNSWV